MPIFTAKGNLMSYPSEKADSLESFVRQSIRLPTKVFHLYHALRWVERKKSRPGFCKPIFVGYRELADESRLDIKSIPSALIGLREAGICTVKIGEPKLGGKRATEIRRLPIDEIKSRQNVRHDDVAHRLAAALSARSFRFGGNTIQPIWSVSRTGRVQSAKPNIQGETHSDRVAGLKAGLQPGQVLVHADIKSADPSVIKHLLGIPLARDLYQEYASAARCTRDEAKQKINAVAYVKNSMRCFPHWPDAAQAALRDYVEKLHAFKIQLYHEARKSRFVTTLSSRIIAAEPRERLHPGRVLCWHVQGTVADVLNGVCLSLLDVASVVVPLHDAAYLILPADKQGLVESEILAQARQLGLALKTKTEVFPPR